MNTPVRLLLVALPLGAAALAGYLWKNHDTSIIHPARIAYGFPADTTLYQGRSPRLPAPDNNLQASDRAVLDRGMELVRSGQGSRALELFEELTRRTPSASDAWALAARLRLDTKNTADSLRADTLIQRGLAQDPGHPWLLLFQARRSIQTQALKDAKELLEKALDFAPTFRPAMEELARLELKSGNAVRAQRLAQLSLSLASGRDTLPYDLVAEALFAREKDDSARECLRLGLERYPSQPRYLWIRGLLAETAGDTASARADYEKARSTGHIPEAEEALRTLGLKPLHGSGRMGGSFSGTKASEVSFAIEVLQPLIRSYPHVAALHYALGRAWQEKGYLAQADDAYQKALSLDSTVPGLMPWSQQNRKTLREKTERFALATKASGEAASVSQDDHWYDLGHYKVRWGVSRFDFLSQFPSGRFEKPTPTSLFESRVMWGIEHRQVLRFDSTGLWSVRVNLIDAGKSSVDLLEEGIRLNALQAGSGNFDDPRVCPELGQVESVWWETADTYELMVQSKKSPKMLGLIRLSKARVPEGGVCVLAPMALDTLL
ncbi:MAG: tetratricopeptide repeat protein [Fibrobacteria bacterium]|nr:tetratricopeptide repeat protein [Fibrobacteria bacterium]